MGNYNFAMGGGFGFLGLLALILGIGAIALTVLRGGKNAQTIRAIAVVAIFAAITLQSFPSGSNHPMGFWLGLVAAAWAAVDFILPTLNIQITAKKPVGKPAKK
jgi:hypothetical protein